MHNAKCKTNKAFCIRHCAFLVLLCGCGSKSETIPPTSPAPTRSTATPADRQAIRAVSLPDLSSVSAPVQDQMRAQHASLQRMIESGVTPGAELAGAYGDMGKLLMAAEYLAAAEPCFLNAQTLSPGDGRWPYYLGHLYRLNGESPKSAASFERSLQTRPDDVPALFWLGNIYLDQGRLDEAESLFTRALSIQPRSLSARFGLGRTALARRQYIPAVKNLEEALALDQRAALVHYPLAMAYRGLGEPAKAEAHLRQWRGDVEVAPPDPLMQELGGLLKSAVVYENHGVRALNTRDWPAAVDYFRKGLELAPDNLSLRHKLGTALSLTGDVAGALQQFEEVVRRSPEFAEAHYSIGALLASNHRYREAIERFSMAVKYDPTYIEARLQLAHALRRSGSRTQSLSEYAQVIKIDPRVAEAWSGYAMALGGLERYEEARDWLTEGMRTHPDQPEIAQALARLLAAARDQGVRDGPRAMAIMQALLQQQQPRTPDVSETMAMAFAELGQYEEAANWQRGAIGAARQAGRADLVPRMAETLRLYEQRKPCRSPWRDDDR
jgi:tetratricopeptide (TPR) repeat protein